VISRFDEGLFAVEKAVVAAILAVMGAVVFLDVAHRVSTRSESLLAHPGFVAAASAIVAAMAFRTRGKAPWLGVVVGVAVAGAQIAFVKLFPNGFVWSQTLALSLTLWMGLIGASLAAHDRRHLALDVGSKIWPAHLAGKVAAVGHVATAAFCVGLLWLAWRSLDQHYATWADSDGAAGTLSGTAIPKWAATAGIPYGMSVLGFRFLLEAWRTWTGQIEVGGDDTLHQLGIEEEKAS
jgi:TRAP-type C4-dicarboxylate transport system permease small subunit